MSQILETVFIEPQPGQWYYLLEEPTAPTEAMDWRDYAKAIGPFSSYEEADAYFCENEVSTSGATRIPHDEFVMDAEYQRLIDKARKPKQSLCNGRR